MTQVYRPMLFFLWKTTVTYKTWESEESSWNSFILDHPNLSLWITKTDDALCFVCKRGTETLGHFLFDCPDFREHFDSLWSKLCPKVTASNPLDGGQFVGFLVSLDWHHKAMLLQGCPLSLLTPQL